MSVSFKALVAAALIALPGAAWAQDSAAPEDAAVYFVNLEDGATVTSPVTVIFGLSNMGVAPAGHERDGSGHHHIFLNRAPFGEAGDLTTEIMELGIPADDNHLHFGGGQTEVTLDLPPGEHTMQLVLGDHDHIPHMPAVTSDYITITVE